jgi:hypothetical protein
MAARTRDINRGHPLDMNADLAAIDVSARDYA